MIRWIKQILLEQAIKRINKVLLREALIAAVTAFVITFASKMGWQVGAELADKLTAELDELLPKHNALA